MSLHEGTASGVTEGVDCVCCSSHYSSLCCQVCKWRPPLTEGIMLRIRDGAEPSWSTLKLSFKRVCCMLRSLASHALIMALLTGPCHGPVWPICSQPRRWGIARDAWARIEA